MPPVPERLPRRAAALAEVLRPEGGSFTDQEAYEGWKRKAMPN